MSVMGRALSAAVCSRCLTLLEILEIYWNYFSSWKSWKSSGNLQNLLEIFRLSLCVCCYYDTQFLYFKMYQWKHLAVNQDELVLLDDTVIGIGRGLSPHASSFKLKFTVSKTSNYTEFFVKMSPENSWKSITDTLTHISRPMPCNSVRHPVCSMTTISA